jgi:nucleoside-diphosphate kinase
MEHTLILVKPLGLQNALMEIMRALKGVGAVTKRRLVPVTCARMAEHYAEHSGKSHFDALVGYYAGETVMALVLEGQDVVARVRGMLGPSNPRDAAPDQLRRLVLEKFQDGQNGWRAIELATSGVDNFIHASDSPAAAEREIALWFPERR